MRANGSRAMRVNDKQNSLREGYGDILPGPGKQNSLRRKYGYIVKNKIYRVKEKIVKVKNII